MNKLVISVIESGQRINKDGINTFEVCATGVIQHTESGKILGFTALGTVVWPPIGSDIVCDSLDDATSGAVHQLDYTATTLCTDFSTDIV